MDKEWSPVRDDAPSKPKKAKFDSYDTGHEHKHPSLKALVITAGLVALFIVVIAFTIGRDDAPAQADTAALDTRLAQQEQQIATLTAQRDSLQRQLDSQPVSNTTQSAAELDRLLEICSKDVNAVRKQLDSCEEENDDTADLVADAGRRLCCIARVSDSSITAYEVDGDRIRCVKSGGNPISC